MKLWYDKPAHFWHEALPIGNGRMGGMVHGGITRELIQLNEDSVWSGKHLNRINPDAKENLPVIRKLIREGRVEEAQQPAMYALSGMPNSQRSYQTAGGQLRGMGLRSGGTLDMEWKDGKVLWYRIVPGRDTELVICVNRKTEEVKLQDGVIYCGK